MKRVLVTGGAGYIGGAFIRHILQEYPSWEVINVDSLTYAGDLTRLQEAAINPQYTFVHGDVTDLPLMRRLMKGVDAVVHLAAETHVDRSLLGPGAFITTDVYGTYTTLEACREHNVSRILHVSTDEVYGEAPTDRASLEDDPLKPRNPYSASKAGAEMQCKAFHATYGLPVIIARPSNNLGPYQHPEKAIPLFTTNAMQDLPLPIYGDGRQIREWIHVEDTSRALAVLLTKGEPGEAYNVGTESSCQNIDLARDILKILDKPESLLRFVQDREGHDRRYRTDCARLRSLGWSPTYTFPQALQQTVQWYRENRWWWEPLRGPDFQRYYTEQYQERLASSKPVT